METLPQLAVASTTGPEAKETAMMREIEWALVFVLAFLLVIILYRIVLLLAATPG